MAHRILVLGATGMLGHRLLARCAADTHAFGTVRGPAALWRGHPALQGAGLVGGVSAERLETLAMAMDVTEPDVVVNCIGLVKQRPEGNDPAAAYSVNGVLPHRAAAMAAERGARFIHLSTDCVFSGTLGRPYRETDVADATDVYGRSKLAGEVSVPGALTLRTSTIGWELVHPTSGLLEWAVSQSGETVRGFRNAFFTGLTTSTLSELLFWLIQNRPTLQGLRHAAAAPISKYDLLVKLNATLGLHLNIKGADEPHIDRRLDGSRLDAETGLPQASWDEMLHGLAAERGALPFQAYE